jgi:endonuclease III
MEQCKYVSRGRDGRNGAFRAILAPVSPREAARSRALEAYRILGPIWPDSKPMLSYADPFELVCAVALSAQCTDEQVNKATPGLFASWPTPAAMASAPVAEVEAAIRSLGFFRVKARHLVEAARIIEEMHGGKVPSTMEGLLELPGVGRKTANLVLSACFGQPGIIVDTHVLRVCLRLALGKKADATDMERRISELVPREHWTVFSHAVNRHGKFVCVARKPACVPGSPLAPCPLLAICPQVGL